MLIFCTMMTLNLELKEKFLLRTLTHIYIFVLVALAAWRENKRNYEMNCTALLRKNKVRTGEKNSVSTTFH